MKDMNAVMITGNLTKAPDLRYGPAGKAFCMGCVAVHSAYKKGGEWEETTSYIDIKAWGKTAELLAKMDKGTKVVLSGEIRQETWNDKTTGSKRYSTFVVAWMVNACIKPAGTNEKPGPAGPDDDVPF